MGIFRAMGGVSLFPDDTFFNDIRILFIQAIYPPSLLAARTGDLLRGI